MSKPDESKPRTWELWKKIGTRNKHRVEAVKILAAAGWSTEQIAFVLGRRPEYVIRIMKIRRYGCE